MRSIKNLHNLVSMYVETWATRAGIETRNDDGAFTVELALLIGALTVGATAAGVVIMSKMTTATNSIPDVQAPVAP